MSLYNSTFLYSFDLEIDICQLFDRSELLETSKTFLQGRDLCKLKV